MNCVLLGYFLLLWVNLSVTADYKVQQNPRFYGVKVGKKVGFFCSASDLTLEKSTVKWYKIKKYEEDKLYSGLNNTFQDPRVEENTSEMQGRLVFKMVEVKDSGIYYCKINDQWGPGSELQVIKHQLSCAEERVSTVNATNPTVQIQIMPEKQIWFIVQTLDEVSRLLEESESVSWNEDKLDTFLHMLDLQANGLRSCPEKQIWFIVQTLDEVSRLLEESESVSWNEDKLDTFLHMLDLQANGLRSCLEHRMKKSKRLPLYFKRLRDLSKNNKPEKQIWFIVQTLDEVSRLLEESESVSWNEDKLDTFLHMLDLQANGLRSCLEHRMKKSKRLPLYFKRLRDLSKNNKGEENSVSSIPDNWHHWFLNHSYSQPEKQIWFIVQTLDEVSRLLEESESVSWNEDKLDTFLHMLDLQANGLRSCLEHRMKKSKRLPLYFKRLRDLSKNNKPEKQIWFIVQTLDEVSRLLEESESVSWNEDKLDTFLHMLDLQANGLRSCLEHRMKKSKRLPLYFKRLRDLSKNNKQEKNAAWETIRKELLQLFGIFDFFPAVSGSRVANHKQRSVKVVQ
ncbi:B-cell antigen receptor complex-associated protein beta chain [Silurus asotus]|uniref:B-cell antigen receptor complex-associated protein beta chain n=1 Tax=Silurus asotus TaxID=30991 RepID=A0AAD5FBQ5_SILAS|nr:B-cell antigen receptor complex-associated protein beta chain [Silurus asotus]